MSKVTITHPGIIKKLTDRKADVSIIVNSGCASCEVKNSCSISESKEKIIEIDLLSTDNFKLGQQVIVEMKQSLGTWAVLLGYFFPFLILISCLIVLTSFSVDEGLAAIVSLGLLIPYYLLLYLLKGKLVKQFSYSMSPA